jgi:hypothetical protein
MRFEMGEAYLEAQVLSGVVGTLLSCSSVQAHGDSFETVQERLS